MLSPFFVLLYENGHQTNSSTKFFFNIDIIKREGLDPIFRGLVSNVAQEIDEKIIDDIRNQTIRFNFKIDLLAYDIQSAREFGIPDYNKTRKDIGLAPVTNFAI